MDRNDDISGATNRIFRSLSARRAWIEICYLDNIEITEAVALRKESVDRNFLELSPWGGWGVALRKESVDRNQRIAKPFREQFKCRSPQGERG